MFGLPVIKELLMESGMSQTKTTDCTSPQTFQSWSNASVKTFSIPRDRLCFLIFVDTACNGSPTGTIALLLRKVRIAFSLNFTANTFKYV